ncbi:hypothetical protein Taro_056208 [Colocasia esculenta]|uniref:Uncharacterized protein n=1 Tax=Colocasia esculenta TaxID=4460 RepID=A0A843XWK6_COLES|nr:hypothetical protein [Colocasia esculenta]
MLHNYEDHSGGRIWVLWNGAAIQMHSVKTTSQLIHLDCTELISGKVSHLTAHSTFYSTVQSAWNSDVQGTPLFVLCQKLRVVKAALKVWNRDDFGTIHHRVQCAASVLHVAQLNLSTDPMNNEYGKREKQAREDYLHSLRMEASYAKQLAKQHCLGP